MTWEQVQVGVTGTLRWRIYGSIRRGESAWCEPVPCVVDEVWEGDVMEDGKVKAVYVKTLKPPRNPKQRGYHETLPRRWRVFSAVEAKNPGTWRNMKTAAKQDGLVAVKLDL